MVRKSKQDENTSTPRDDTPVTVRLPPELLIAVDAWVASTQSAQPGIRVNRSDAVRALLYSAVEKRG